ncbi:YafY family protein [Paenarthrobacter aurescens]|uniref:helix-turn-helix transcriptional regulator n=1 Tax=Paenarthrobacter aurescens TaxID=43663 RepID=UPI001580D570|nr:WYL domain-containing protein [Paenarthrobacter aurescens]UKA51878.1 WYL domain-containing protein [Arthrobacter sp. FW305-123]MDO6143628.1 WYL domain-containing protein [Paenarthrobacter aurescens]MDO6147476.1 WYL domain-containing protein [Paenarthrobacter aurescens]MDO6158719.1 WYL domain-containing protein [Paenarthrobacter aurescens]MDO6162703.1 WYL domain-containing protein [Paenarthrobacter aurescens]
MSASRTERLLNLLLALLNTKVGLPRAVLREKVYHDSADNDVAFGRMFERDKVDLKQFGFEIETLMDPRNFGADDPASARYRIGKDSNRLPDVSLTPAESTVLLLAAQLWERAALGSAAANAVRKLQAAGGFRDVDLPAGVQPRIKPAGQAFDDVVAAMHGKHPIRFGYQAVSTGREEVREVEPWGLGSRFGQWYLVGLDRGRGAKRVFRLSRMTTAISVLTTGSFHPPKDFNARAELDELNELPVRQATLVIDKDKLLALRKKATSLQDAPDESGRDRITVDFRDPEQLAEELASYGPHVKVTGPAELSAAVVRRLQAAADFDDAPLPPLEFPEAGRAPRARKRTSEDQLARMLQLVPFLVHHQGLHIQEVADHFGISRKALIDDLKILICSGLPEGYPDDLLDIQWENDHVYISEHLDLNRPVRFSEEEAAALLTGLAMLGDLPALAGVPEDGSGSALESVTIKLTGAAGEAARLAGSVSGQSVAPEQAQAFAAITQAIREGRQLRLRYFSLQRDEVTERDVDPLRLYSLDSTWYFEAYCHSKAGVRNFRLDRVESLEPNGRAVSGSATAGQDFPARLFTPGEDDVLVCLELTRQGAGLADDYYAERTAPLPDGGLLAEVRFGDAGWLPMFVSQHGGSVRILEPESLRQETRAWIDAALVQYDSPTGTKAG